MTQSNQAWPIHGMQTEAAYAFLVTPQVHSNSSWSDKHGVGPDHLPRSMQFDSGF